MVRKLVFFLLGAAAASLLTTQAGSISLRSQQIETAAQTVDDEQLESQLCEKDEENLAQARAEGFLSKLGGAVIGGVKALAGGGQNKKCN